MATLPRGMAARQAEMRKEREDDEFDLLAYIMRRYNEEGRTLEGIVEDVGVAMSTLNAWLAQCGVRIDRKMVQIGAEVQA